MVKVFIFTRPSIPKILAGDEETPWKRMNSKWIFLDTHSKELTLVYSDHQLQFTLLDSTQFAIFNEQLIPLKTCNHRILLVSDLDNTVFNRRAEGRTAHSAFIRFWIENYEFNGSKLVYNTGRRISEYMKDKHDFYEPDLLLTSLGNYAHKFDYDGNIVFQDSLQMFIEQLKDDDWDANEYYEDFKAHFPSITEFFISLDPYNIYFKIPKNQYDENIFEIINHIKNENQRTINGKIMKAKISISSQGPKEIRPLEIIPKFGGKGLAAKYAQWVLGFADCDTFTAGDSLNDKDALKVKCRGVLVGNAEEKLVQWYSKKERNHLFYSHQFYANGIIDLLSNYNLHESFSTIYIYRPQDPNSQVLINGEVQVLKTFKNKWFYFQTNSNSFDLHSDTIKSFEIPVGGRYALYDSSLITIKPNLSSILFVTDLDNTIFNESEEGLKYYKNFIKFWVTFFEFNGSFLVYNTGRSMTDYLEDDQRLFKPDLAILCLSSYAYVLDEDLSLKEDLGLRTFNNSQKHDWDTKLFAEVLCEKLRIGHEKIVRLYDTFLLIKLEKNFALEHFKEIRAFAKNKERIPMINGRVFHAEIVIIKYNLVDERFYEIRPLFVGKGIGVEYSRKKFGLFAEETFTAGDSPNDIDSLKIPVNGIVMKNSEEMLIEWYGKKERKHLVVSEENWALGLQIELEKRLILS